MTTPENEWEGAAAPRCWTIALDLLLHLNHDRCHRRPPRTGPSWMGDYAEGMRDPLEVWAAQVNHTSHSQMVAGMGGE